MLIYLITGAGVCRRETLKKLTPGAFIASHVVQTQLHVHECLLKAQLLLLLLCVEVWFFFSQSRACGTPLKTSLWTQGRHSHSSLIWQIPWSIWRPTIHHYLTKERLNTWSEEVDLCYTLNIHRYIFFP